MIKEAVCTYCQTFINEGKEKEIILSELDDVDVLRELAKKFGFTDYITGSFELSDISHIPDELVGILRSRGKIKEIVKDKGSKVVEVVIDHEDYRDALLERIKKKAQSVIIGDDRVIVKGYKSVYEEERDLDDSLIEQRWLCPVCKKVVCRVVYGDIIGS